MFADQKGEMAGDKGSRGTQYDKDFEKVGAPAEQPAVIPSHPVPSSLSPSHLIPLQLEKSRVPRAANVVANRNRDPAELGLKQWTGD